MTDKETMQMALDALLTNMDARLGVADKMYVASHAILALRKQLQQPERRALTSDQINKISQELWDDPSKNYTAHTMARAIEDAHGIEETK